jgi:hypothetical protein
MQNFLSYIIYKDKIGTCQIDTDTCIREPNLVYSLSLYCNESLYQISRKSYENFKRYAYFFKSFI